MDTDNFIINIKTEDVFEDIANVIEKRFNTLNYEFNRLFPTGKNKKVIGLMKGMKGLLKGWWKAKGTKKCVIQWILKINDYKNCLLNNKMIIKSQQRFKRKVHNYIY